MQTCMDLWQTVHVGDQTEHIVNCPTLLISLQLLKQSQLSGPPLTKKRYSIKILLVSSTPQLNLFFLYIEFRRDNSVNRAYN